MRIPDTAKLIDSAVGILPSGRWEGSTIKMCLWEAYSSKGYHSSYQRIIHRYVQYEIENGPCGCRSYSGKNFKNAAAQLAELRAAMLVTN